MIAGMAAAGVVAAAGGIAWKLRGKAIPGALAGADMARGHRLRDGGFPPPTIEERTGVVIAGGGVSGLSAAWTLAEAGHDDFTLLELEDRTGGNARSGRNAVSAFPLGAHYLPVPNREATALRAMLAKLGMIVGEKDGAPIYDPFQLCADLHERLFYQGRWQEGLIPRRGLSPADRHDLDAFAAAMAAFSARIGSDGRPAFAVPMAYSSRDPDLLALDGVSFREWLDQRGWRSPVLRNHVRYCMRDDYGCEPDHVSAWAGVHYFAARRGWAADDAGDNELTWPEGNGHLVQAMAARFPTRIASGRIVHRITRDGDGVAVDSHDVARNATVRTRADAAIIAVPHFIAARIAPDAAPDAAGFGYAPWVVANVTVSRLPQGRGARLAWDNVSWTSESLGYVVATHQGPAARTAGTVLTWYMPLSHMAPADARRLMLDRPLAEWQAMVRDDLTAMHPDLEDAIQSIDIWRWGHAMIRPAPGFIWGAAQRAAEAARPPFFLAHSDLSGLSLFEEAHYRGTMAAEGAMAHIGHGFTSML